MDIPVTTAIRALRAGHAAFTPRVYDYAEHGGTDRAARELGIAEHETVKTIVMETEAKKPFIVLMHGDREISTKQMARLLGVKSVAPCSPECATRHTGYLVGGPVLLAHGSRCRFTPRRRSSTCRASSSTAGGAVCWLKSRRTCWTGCFDRNGFRWRSASDPLRSLRLSFNCFLFIGRAGGTRGSGARPIPPGGRRVWPD